MKNLLLSVVALAVFAGPAFASSASQQSAAAPATQSPDKTPPSYDMKPQSLQDLEDMHKKFVALATAIPQEKYSYRPAEGVRSIGEVFLHVSNANYNIPSLMGAPLPANFDPKTFEKSTTDKTQIIDQLNKSFDSARAAIEKMTNGDFAKPLPKLGPDANYGDVVYLLVTHAHEHMGQSIAYARVNGIVPPWTAEAAKKGQTKD
jgi:uncharacterized damage-inducible protein DinB